MGPHGDRQGVEATGATGGKGAEVASTMGGNTVEASWSCHLCPMDQRKGSGGVAPASENSGRAEAVGGGDDRQGRGIFRITKIRSTILEK